MKQVQYRLLDLKTYSVSSDFISVKKRSKNRNRTVKLMVKDTYMYCLDFVYKDTCYWKCSSIVFSGRAKTGIFEGDGPIESVSITGTHPHLPIPMKHNLCEAKYKLKNIYLSSVHKVWTMCA